MIHRNCSRICLLTMCMMAAATAMVGCSTTPTTLADREQLHAEVQNTIERFKSVDPTMAELFTSAPGYAVFPTIGKGAVGVGGAYGKGELFEDGMMIGYCDMTQATIGFQLGGQTYSELIFFQNQQSLDVFKYGNLEFAAQASAVAATAGASTDADYAYGVLVFTLPTAGLMYEASIGGQKFDYEPK